MEDVIVKEELKRVVGHYTSGQEGPLLIISGSVHGNEPSGLEALTSVFEVLQADKPAIKGTVLGIAGNLSAFKKNKRYIDEDLNRTWTEENIAAGKVDSNEKREMFDIIETIKDFEAKTDYTTRYFLDCHTTSADTLPFISVQEVNDNDAWAHRFPTYIIRGFSDMVEGCIDHYLSRIGITGFVFEAGQHTSPASRHNQEGIIWLVLKEACGLKLEDLRCYPDSIDRFVEENAPGQDTFEILYRHALNEGDTFKMKPGYQNFQHISKGEILATQNGQEVVSEWDAYIHMPLYQAQGNDGFFVIDKVK